MSFSKSPILVKKIGKYKTRIDKIVTVERIKPYIDENSFVVYGYHHEDGAFDVWTPTGQNLYQDIECDNDIIEYIGE